MGRRDGGHTLVELLVVLLIIGLALGVVGISLDSGAERRRTTAFAERLAREATLQLEEAEADGRHRGLALRRGDDGGWVMHWMRQLDDRWHDTAGALPDGVALLAEPAPLPRGVEPALRVAGVPVVLVEREPDQNHSVPDIVLFASGEMTPFFLALSTDAAESATGPGLAPTLTLCGDALGRISLALDDGAAALRCEAGR